MPSREDLILLNMAGIGKKGLEKFSNEALDAEIKKARKKLIICFTQTHQLDKALDIFINLITEDGEGGGPYILNTCKEE